MCAFFRSQENTRGIPIVCISPENSSELYEPDLIDKIDIVQAPFSVGTLAGRIATQLRLRKQAGGDELQGTLAEINAALQQPDVKDLFEKQSLRLIGGTPERLAALMQSETTRWNRVVKDAGIKPE